MEESFSLDEKFISNIFKKYQQAKILLPKDSLQEHQVYYGKKQIDFNKLVDYQRHLQIVETILVLMPKAEYRCLVAEFLNDDEKNWWMKHYSQEYYQKLRYKAITRFLYLFLI